MSKAFVGGKKSSTLIAFIRSGKYLTPDYPKKAYALFDKYHPIEISTTIPLKEKKKKMQEWWRAHNDLLIKSGMNLKVARDIVKKQDFCFRGNISKFFKSLYKNKIPLIILSASRGILIKLFLEKYNYMDKNTHIIANNFKFDKNGIAIGYDEPVIHTFNKTETSVKHLPIYNDLLKRKNVILLGDLIGDVGMIEGFPYENLIKIGFLNENVDERLEEFKKNYDVVILNDGTFDYVNGLVGEVVG